MPLKDTSHASEDTQVTLKGDLKRISGKSPVVMAKFGISKFPWNGVLLGKYTGCCCYTITKDGKLFSEILSN